ncbi:MAG: hypothetical protein M3065_15085 [Actinomycetota bacterium]|nr:hypothetical protein [Actinomycetota bacterium]
MLIASSRTGQDANNTTPIRIGGPIYNGSQYRAGDFPILSAVDLQGKPASGTADQVGAPDISLPHVTSLTNTPIFIGDSGAGKPFAMVSSDNQFVRLANGDVLLVFIAVTRVRPSDAAGQALWEQWKPFNGGWRGVLMTWRSKDCGQSWATGTGLDSASTKIGGEVGRCGWPSSIDPPSATDTDPFTNTQYGDRTTGPTNPSTGKPYPNGWWWVGGSDREELYTNAFHPQNVYISEQCGGGAAIPAYAGRTVMQANPFASHSYSRPVLFRSANYGRTWLKTGRELPSDSGVPAVMTSAPKFTYSFSCDDTGAPRLLQLGPKIRDFNLHRPSQGTPACDLYTKPDYTKPDKPSMDYNLNSLSISRALTDGKDHALPNDNVRVAYPFAVPRGTHHRLGIQVLDVQMQGPSKRPTVMPLLALRAKDPKGDLTMPNFIETDRPRRGHSFFDTAALQYYETDAQKHSFPRLVVFRHDRKSCAPFHLSDDATNNLTGSGPGDYVKGTSFFHKDDIQFVAQWPAVFKVGQQPMQGLRYRIVPGGNCDAKNHKPAVLPSGTHHPLTAPPRVDTAFEH